MQTKIYMRLDDIGFYTLSDARAYSASEKSRLTRCELILTGKCNFKCPYCRRVGGKDYDLAQAKETLRLWASDSLYAVRFSGGEPTMYTGLGDLVALSKRLGIQRIALSTNGSAPVEQYLELWASGVNDFSISLDACCAEDGDKMAGGIRGAWNQTVQNIKALAKLTYVTVGVVLTEDNVNSVNAIIRFASDLGVSDIRVIPAAQATNSLKNISLENALLTKHPILSYRFRNLQQRRAVRGLRLGDPPRCPLVLDDMAVSQGLHYPCIIYFREGGPAIGKVGPEMRRERANWYRHHNTLNDSICSKNCLDVCADYNRRYLSCHSGVQYQNSNHLCSIGKHGGEVHL
jgi:MoaA/NifB/PqqE/SkfB family radical SAM enzyme